MRQIYEYAKLLHQVSSIFAQFTPTPPNHLFKCSIHGAEKRALAESGNISKTFWNTSFKMVTSLSLYPRHSETQVSKLVTSLTLLLTCRYIRRAQKTIFRVINTPILWVYNSESPISWLQMPPVKFWFSFHVKVYDEFQEIVPYSPPASLPPSTLVCVEPRYKSQVPNYHEDSFNLQIILNCLQCAFYYSSVAC